MMDDRELLERWKRLCGDTSPTPWTEDDLVGFFQRFRPDGAGIEAVFDGVEAGDEIVPRLQEVYRATGEGWQHGDIVDGYFVVRNPPPLTANRAIALLREHLDNLAAISRAIGCDELTTLLDSPVLEVVEGDAPEPGDFDGPATLVYDATCRFMESLVPTPSAAFLMGEAFWTIACDPYLTHHLLWPLYRDATPVVEPFRPYFDLWIHGASIHFADEWTVRVFVPEGRPG